jgi:hypothetical protein
LRFVEKRGIALIDSAGVLLLLLSHLLVDAVAPASPRHSEEREAGIVAIEVSMRRELERSPGGSSGTGGSVP